MVARETSALQEVTAALAEAGIPASEEALGRLARFTDLLLSKALPLGFIGPQEADRLIPRHITESAALSRFLAQGQRIADVGSGAGLPGIVLACLGWSVEPVETLERRAQFLREVVDELGIETVVHQMRAEDAGRSDLRESFDAVVARALAAPTVSLELCLPLVRPGGALLLAATRGDAEDDVVLRVVAAELGGGALRWEDLLVPGADPPRCVIIVDKVHPTPDRYPRRAGVPKRRPLG